MESIANPSGNLEILIVDDDKIVSLIHKRVLERSNINTEPLFFGEGLAALDYIVDHQKSGTNFLVLLDLNMPVMDGWGFIDNCKNMKFPLKIFIVVITSSINNSDLYRALNYKQVIGFCSKPFTIKTMQGLMEFPAVKNLFIEMEYEALENGTW